MDGDGGARIHSMIEDGPLGRWRVDLCRPRADLAACVAQLWYGEGTVNYQRDRILPGTGSFLLINLGPPQYRIESRADGSERRLRFDDIWYSGLQLAPIDTEAPHGSALLGVAFHAHGARPWLHVDADDSVDRVGPLADWLGDSVLALRQRLLQTQSIERRFALVEDWLAGRLAPRFVASELVIGCLQRIADSDGVLAVEVLAKDAGVSRKHLGERFRREVGLTPKSLSRIHRFRRAMTLLAGRERVPWSELAALCGYYDQSHLIRDFRAFSGMAPGELLRRPQPDSGSLVVS
ncbi:MAG: AraC family transcriptional regulator [Xanthomonadales bacterium]|nr:AraC family transcriptional regulator [Xanthomonadales bacterium]